MSRRVQPKALHLGYERLTGHSVEIPVGHMFIAGQSGASGKTTTLKSLAQRDGLRVLVFDVKRDRDWADLKKSTMLRPFFRQALEPLMVKELLEATGRMKLKREFATLVQLCDDVNSLEDIQNRADEKKVEKRTPPIVKDMLVTLSYLLGTLVKEVEQYVFEDQDLKLQDDVNVMDLSQFSEGLQQLVVASTCQELLAHHRNTIVILDEAHRFIPEDGSSAARIAVRRILQEGRSQGLFAWLSDQTITGVEKSPLKQARVWLLGQQMEKNEVDRTIKQIPHARGISTETIMTLGLGTFFVVMEDKVHLTYITPWWATLGEARYASSSPDGHVALPMNLAIDIEDKKGRDHMDRAEKRKYEQEIAELKRQVKDLQRHEREDAPLILPGTKPVRFRGRPSPPIESVPVADLAGLGRIGQRIPAEAAEPDGDPVAGGRRVALVDSSGKVLRQFNGALPTEPFNLVVLKSVSTIEISVIREQIQTDEKTPRGRLATLLLHGFFVQGKKAGEIYAEAAARGWGSWVSSGGSKKACERELKWLAAAGFIRIGREANQNTYTMTEGALKRVNVRN